MFISEATGESLMQSRKGGQQEPKPRCNSCGTDVSKTVRGKAERAAGEAKVAQQEIQQQRAMAQRAQQQQRGMQQQAMERQAAQRGTIAGASGMRPGMGSPVQQQGMPQGPQQIDPRLAQILQALAAQQRSR